MRLLLLALVVSLAIADELPGPPGLRISVDYDQTPLQQVCRDLSDRIGVRVVCPRELAALPISLRLDDVRWRTVVELIAWQYELQLVVWRTGRAAAPEGSAESPAQARDASSLPTGPRNASAATAHERPWSPRPPRSPTAVTDTELGSQRNCVGDPRVSFFP